jgi:PAS domain S-box-containing protein
MNRILRRQLRRAFSVASDEELAALLETAPGSDPAALPARATVARGLGSLLARIGETYDQYERDLTLRSRSLELSSEELSRANARLREEAVSQGRAIASMRQTADAISRSMGRASSSRDDNLESLSELMATLVRERSQFQRELEWQKFALDQHAIVSIADADGDILYANDKLCEISGYTAEELVGRNLRVFRSNYHPPEFFNEMWRIISSGKVWRGEICNRTKAGSLYWVNATTVPVCDDQGKPHQYVSIRNDITTRKNVEKLLKEAVDRAEAANRAKSEFLATVSHEIRTPMNGVIGMIGLLLDTDLTEEQTHFANTVRHSAEALLTIIDAILDFSKMEAGKLELHETDFDIESLVKGVSDVLRPRLGDKSVDLTYSVPKEAGGIYRSDAGRLRQVLLNLAGNAIKFTRSGSVAILVSLRKVEADIARVRFRVVDTGIGIPDVARSKLFGMFNQADSTTSRRFGGTGLGLAICKRIVDLLGGEIGYESLEGQGSTFWFEVPLKFAAEDDSQQRPDALLGARILVVDDNQVNREVLKRQMANWGASVDLAESAAPGLIRIREAINSGKPYDMVLLDHQMPGMIGLELASVLRADPSFASTRLVMVSSDYSLEVKDVSHGLFDKILFKPVRQSTLFNTLASLLGRKGPGRDESEAARAADAGPVAPAKGLRILLAEDIEVNQEVAARLLARLGHEVVVVGNGAEALKAAQGAGYDVVLMDVQMPEMDGLEATLAIRALPSPACDVPIIAMTAAAMRGDAEKCLEFGMNGYISKPIDRAKLRSVLAPYLTVQV